MEEQSYAALNQGTSGSWAVGSGEIENKYFPALSQAFGPADTLILAF